MKAKPKNIDEYLAAVSGEKRAALQKLRRDIKSAAPKAEECISYQIPAFRLDGRLLVAFGAAAKHCAFYPGAHPVEAHKSELEAYDTSKGTIRFPADKPLPAPLVRKLVKTRIAEYGAPRRKRNPSVVAMLLLSIAAASSAAVVDVSGSGFFVRHEAVVAATPERVYRAMTSQVGSWWNPDHTRSGDSRNLTLDARPGGCFCERLPKGGGAEHLRVVYVVPEEVLRMSGALGPLQESGLAGSMTWKLTASGSSTKVELSYGVGGHFRGGFEKIAPAVDGVVGDQLERMKRFVESARK